MQPSAMFTPPPGAVTARPTPPVGENRVDLTALPAASALPGPAHTPAPAARAAYPDVARSGDGSSDDDENTPFIATPRSLGLSDGASSSGSSYSSDYDYDFDDSGGYESDPFHAGDSTGLHVLPPAPPAPLRPVERQGVLAWSLWFSATFIVAAANPVLWSASIKFIVRAQPEVAAVGCGLAVVCALILVRARGFIRDHRPDHFDVLHALDFFAAGTVLWTWANNAGMLFFTPKQPLTDILYTVTPEATPSSILYYTNDVMLYGAAVAAVVFTLTRKDSWERAAFVRTVFCRLGIIQFIRLVLTPLTTLPDPAAHCRPGPTLHVDVPKQAVDVISRLGPIDERWSVCGGQAFSGQAGTLLALVMVLTKFFNQQGMQPDNRREPVPSTAPRVWTQRTVRVVGVVYSALYALFVLICRKHYTVDVVLAYGVVFIMDDMFDVRPWEHLTQWWPSNALIDARRA